MDFIKDILENKNLFGGFKIIKYEKSKYDKPDDNVWYGEAKDRIGMTFINWSTEGHHCTYFGKKLENNISVSIRKDGGTRTVFNGYCFNKEEFLKVLELTW